MTENLKKSLEHAKKVKELAGKQLKIIQANPNADKDLKVIIQNNYKNASEILESINSNIKLQSQLQKNQQLYSNTEVSDHADKVKKD